MQKPAHRDRAAKLGDERREMRGKKSQLISAREEPQKDQAETRVFEGFGQDLAQTFLKLGFACHFRSMHQRQGQKHG